MPFEQCTVSVAPAASVVVLLERELVHLHRASGIATASPARCSSWARRPSMWIADALGGTCSISPSKRAASLGEQLAVGDARVVHRLEHAVAIAGVRADAELRDDAVALVETR